MRCTEQNTWHVTTLHCTFLACATNMSGDAHLPLQLMGFMLMITLTLDVFLGFLMLHKVETSARLALEIGKSRSSLMLVKMATRHSKQYWRHSVAQVSCSAVLGNVTCTLSTVE